MQHFMICVKRIALLECTPVPHTACRTASPVRQQLFRLVYLFRWNPLMAFIVIRGPLVREALGHHPRDSVTHRDAVQGVRYLHGSLLVRDHDQLRRLLQLLEDGEQARQVHVVQGGLDLVHDVERRRARLKDRDQERDRGQGTLTARQQ